MRFRFLTFILALALLQAQAVAAHLADEFPQVTLQVAIDDEAAELIVRIPARDASLAVLDGLSPIDMDKMEPADLSALITPVFAKRCPVQIDGLVVPPTILGAIVQMSNSRLPARRFPEAQVLKQGTLMFVARYETKGPPRSVSIDWSIFANEYDEQSQPIHADENLQAVVMVSANERETIARLTPIEPAYTWHADQAGPINADILASIPAQRNFLALPALSISLVFTGFLTALIRRRTQRRGVWLTLATSIVAGALTLPFGQIEIEHTSARTGLDDADALAIFESLHRNIYRAFDYTDEGAVYDALAQSVDGPMLETIYNDVYQSLIMREENGAVSKVVRVEIDDAAILPIDQGDSTTRPDPTAYRVHCNWRVDGLVTHFGHAHARINAFEAVYTVAPRADGWRITDAKIIQQRRIDDGTQTANDVINTDPAPSETDTPSEP